MTTTSKQTVSWFGWMMIGARIKEHMPTFGQGSRVFFTPDWVDSIPIEFEHPFTSLYQEIFGEEDKSPPMVQHVHLEDVEIGNKRVRMGWDQRCDVVGVVGNKDNGPEIRDVE